MTAAEARVLTEIRARESTVDWLLRTEVYPRIEAVAGCAESSLTWYPQAFGCYATAESVLDVIKRLEADGFKVEHFWAATPEAVCISW